MSFEQNQNINSSVQESEKKKHRIVIASVDIQQQARDIAEEKMLSSKAELKGFRGFFAKIWRHNLAHEYYRQKEIATARREIKESGNLYAGEKGEKEDHENAMNAIVQRFQAEYEGENLLRKGEEKKTLKSDDPSAPRLKNEISDLIKRFASGNLTEEQFQIEKKNIYGEHTLDVENVSVFADNLLEIAKQVRDSIAHGKGLDALDEDYEIVVGKARAGVETEAQYNAVDRITEKIQKSFIGKFINEATVASAVAIAYGAIAKGAVSVAHRGAKLVGPLGMGLSAAVGGTVAGVRENKRIKEERAQHGREMAKGKKIESGLKSREEMEKFRYETKNANELSGNLKEALEGLKTQPSEQTLHAVLEHLNEINSRTTFSEQEKIDLVSFSDSKNVEKERTEMYIAAAEAKVYLKQNIHADWATFYNNEQQLNEYLQHNKEVKIQKDFLGEKALKDEAFNKMKRKKVAWEVAKGLGIGLGVGMAAQEIGVLAGNGKDGIFSGSGVNGQSQHYTALGYLRHYIAGDLPHDEIVTTKSIVGLKEFIKEYENLFSKIKRVGWMDNNTPKPDGNELKLWWGGDNGTGIDKNGNYVFNIKHMTHEGSFHDGKNFDPQELMREGKMKLLISLSGDTQNQVVEVPIDVDGNAVIDPNSSIGKVAFSGAGGHAKFLGKFAEVAAVGEKENGIESVNVLATHIGKGITHLTETVTSNNIASYDVEAPFVIPVSGRKPMEQLKNEKKNSWSEEGRMKYEENLRQMHQKREEEQEKIEVQNVAQSVAPVQPQNIPPVQTPHVPNVPPVVTPNLSPSRPVQQVPSRPAQIPNVPSTPPVMPPSAPSVTRQNQSQTQSEAQERQKIEKKINEKLTELKNLDLPNSKIFAEDLEYVMKNPNGKMYEFHPQTKLNIINGVVNLSNKSYVSLFDFVDSFNEQDKNERFEIENIGFNPKTEIGEFDLRGFGDSDDGTFVIVMKKEQVKNPATLPVAKKVVQPLYKMST